MGDFNIHVDVNNDSLCTVSICVLFHLFGFCQSVEKPAHSHNHALNFVLVCGFTKKNVSLISLLLDNYLILLPIPIATTVVSTADVYLIDKLYVLRCPVVSEDS